MYSLLQKLKKQKELAQTQAAPNPAMAQEPIEQPMPEEKPQPEMAQERQPFKLSDFMKKAGQFVSKNKDVIIPAAFSATTGMGVLPGLMAGYASRGNAAKLQEQLAQQNDEIAAKNAAEKEKLDWEAKQKELDRKNRIATTSISHSPKPEDPNKVTFTEYSDALKMKNSLLDQGMTEEEVDEQYPDLGLIIKDYEQKSYNQRLYPTE